MQPTNSHYSGRGRGGKGVMPAKNFPSRGIEIDHSLNQFYESEVLN